MSKEEIEKLKQEWCYDPCWDIEETEGFEEHKTELHLFRLQKENEWRKQYEKELQEYANKIGCGSPVLAEKIRRLDLMIYKLEDRIDRLQERQ